MALRSGMVDLVAQVRRLIGDDDSTQYTDDAIQDALDEHRRDLWNWPLRDQGTILPGGTVRYLHFYGPGDMETTGTLYDAQYIPLTGTLAPGTADWGRGYWAFAGSAVSPYGPLRPLTVTGATYEIKAAAVDLLRRWAASVKDLVKYTDPNFTFELNQQYGQLLGMANALAATMKPCVGRVVRVD